MRRSTIPENRLPLRMRELRVGVATPTAKAAADENGLPAWMTQPRSLCIAFLLVLFVLNQIRLSSVNAARVAAEESTKVQVTDCVMFPNPPGNQPATRPVFDPENPHHHMRSWLRVTEQCATEGCTGNNKKNYISILSGYMWVRLTEMEKTYNNSGSAGLRSHFQSRQSHRDYAIIDGAREIIKSGEIKVSELGSQTQQNFLELVIKHRIDPIPVCSTGTTERIKY